MNHMVTHSYTSKGICSCGYMTEYSDFLSTVGYVLQTSSTFQGKMFKWRVTSEIIPGYIHSFLHVAITYRVVTETLY